LELPNCGLDCGPQRLIVLGLSQTTSTSCFATRRPSVLLRPKDYPRSLLRATRLAQLRTRLFLSLLVASSFVRSLPSRGPLPHAHNAACHQSRSHRYWSPEISSSLLSSGWPPLLRRSLVWRWHANRIPTRHLRHLGSLAACSPCQPSDRSDVIMITSAGVMRSPSEAFSTYWSSTDSLRWLQELEIARRMPARAGFSPTLRGHKAGPEQHHGEALSSAPSRS